MKKILSILLSVLIILPGNMVFASNEAEATEELFTNEEIHQFLTEMDELNSKSYDIFSRIVVKSSKNIENCMDAIDMVNIFNDLYVLQYKNKDSAQKAINYYSDLSYVKYAEFDIIKDFELYETSNDYSDYTAECYSTINSNIDDAIKLLSQEVIDLPEIKVAIIDSGISYYTSPKYAKRILKGYNFYDYNDNCSDGSGHGTKVAGVVLLNTPDNVKICPYKISKVNEDYASSVNIAAAFYEASNSGCKVVNCSWGLWNQVIEDAVTTISKQGCIVVTASGNSGGTRKRRWFENSICVGSSTEGNSITSTSVTGKGVDIYAVGSGCSFIGPDGERYGFSFSGTSAAAPIVSSICAILCSFDQSLTVDEIRNALIETGISTVEENKSENRLIADAYGAAKYLFGKELPQVKPVSYTISINEESGNAQIAFDCEDDATICCVLGRGGDLYTPYKYTLSSHYIYEKGTVIEIPMEQYTVTVCAYAPGKAKSVVEYISAPAHTDESGYTLTKASKTQQYNMINKYQLNEKTVTVPSEIDGCEIQEIGRYCFMGNQSVEKIILPETVKQIDRYAFANCPNLKEVIAPGVEVCGMYAFYDSENLINVEMPNVTVANTGIFKNCHSLETAKLGTLTEIDNHAFYGCKNLKLVKTTDNDITTFSTNTFKDCNELTIYTPKNSSMETFVEENDIALLGSVTKNGGSIRVTDAGLRFGYQYNGEENKNIQEYGFVYSSGETDNLTVDNALKLVANNRIDHGEYTTYNLVFTDVPYTDRAFNQKISAKAYIKIGDEYFYSDVVMHSYNTIANAVLNDETIDSNTKKAVQKILDKVV